MELKIFPKLGTCSRRAIQKRAGKFGSYYQYHPRINLVDRLAKELKMSREEILDQIQKERSYLIGNI